MALIACPDCDSRVSDRAPSCPRCGRPIYDAQGAANEEGLEKVLRLWAYYWTGTVACFAGVGSFMALNPTLPDPVKDAKFDSDFFGSFLPLVVIGGLAIAWGPLLSYYSRTRWKK